MRAAIFAVLLLSTSASMAEGYYHRHHRHHERHRSVTPPPPAPPVIHDAQVSMERAVVFAAVTAGSGPLSADVPVCR